MNTDASNPLRSKRRGLAALVALLGTSVPGAAATQKTPSQCEGDHCPSTFTDLPDVKVTKAPATFNFQARISQGKLPVGNATFPKVTVRLNDGTTTLCSESFTDVQAQKSVLNLTIGEQWGATCPIDELMASRTALNFQVCIGTENCLTPVVLNSVPYAVKASYAAVSQTAQTANVAAQCNYAHRVTADRSLFVTEELGAGYYDFHTPTKRELLGVDGGTFNDGFIQWTPVGAGTGTLHLCKKDATTGKLEELVELVLHAARTLATGDLVVDGNAEIQKTLTVNEDLKVLGGADITGQTHLRDSLDVDGTSAFRGKVTADSLFTVEDTGELVVAGATTLNGPASVNGAAEFTGGVTMSNLKTPGSPALEVQGTAKVGTLEVWNLDFPKQGFATVTGNSQVTGVTTFQGPVNFEGGVTLPTTVSLVPGVDSVGTAELKAGSVGPSELQPYAVHAEHIADGAIENRHITSVDASKLIGTPKLKAKVVQKVGTSVDWVTNAKASEFVCWPIAYGAGRCTAGTVGGYWAFTTSNTSGSAGIPCTGYCLRTDGQ